MEKEHLQVILEGMDGKFKLVLEAFDTLNSKIDRKCDELNEKISEVAFEVRTSTFAVRLLGSTS